MKNITLKCINFLTDNGWKFSYTDDENDDDDCKYYDKSECYQIEISKKNNEITYFNDSGDCYTHDINIYTLIGFLFHMRQIDSNYVYRDGRL